jgi:hypothetical protein
VILQGNEPHKAWLCLPYVTIVLAEDVCVVQSYMISIVGWHASVKCCKHDPVGDDHTLKVHC